MCLDFIFRFIVQKNEISVKLLSMQANILTVDSQIDKISSFISIVATENQFQNGEFQLCFGFQQFLLPI